MWSKSQLLGPPKITNESLPRERTAEALKELLWHPLVEALPLCTHKKRLKNSESCTLVMKSRATR